MLSSLSNASPALSAQTAETVQGEQTADTPSDWVDKDTDHHVIRLTKEPDSKGLFFNENAFTPDGREMIYTVHDSIYAVDMMAPHKTYQLAAGSIRQVVVGKKSPTVYFMKVNDSGLYAVNVYTGQKLRICELPAHATISTLNSDETLAAGVYQEEQSVTARQQAPLRSGVRRAAGPLDSGAEKYSQHVLFILDLRTAAISPVVRSPMPLDHALFSPTDPTLLMYWNDDPSSAVDHVWTVRTDGTMNEPVHKRMMDQEIASNAFWDSDGKTVWYDLQAPKGQNFYLASYNLETGLRRWYPMERDQWSIHYSAAVDDSAFCGDGSDYSRIAKSHNGQWIELFYPRKPKTTENSAQNDQSKLIQSGTFISHHLVNMSKDDYSVEPNARFSPNHRLVIFTSTMFGPSYLFAVEVRHTPVAPVVTPSQ